MDEKIVCAAHQLDGVVVCCIRHFDDVAFAVFALYEKPIDWKYSEQGFVTNKGRFVDRKEAWRIATRNGQIVRRVGGDEKDGGTLYSENLY